MIENFLNCTKNCGSIHFQQIQNFSHFRKLFTRFQENFLKLILKFQRYHLKIYLKYSSTNFNLKIIILL